MVRVYTVCITRRNFYKSNLLSASDLGLHSLPLSLLWDTRHKCENAKFALQISVLNRKNVYLNPKHYYELGSRTFAVVRIHRKYRWLAKTSSIHPIPRPPPTPPHPDDFVRVIQSWPFTVCMCPEYPFLHVMVHEENCLPKSNNMKINGTIDSMLS